MEHKLGAAASIRKAVLQDAPYFYEICLKTANDGKDSTALFYDPYMVGQYFAAPYLNYPEARCFVVEQDTVPQGYIVSAPDTSAFNRWMETSWLPPLRKRYAHPHTRSLQEEKIQALFHKTLFPENNAPPWQKEFPAHLHIDLLPAVQGQGWGKTLIETLCAELASLKVPGVHLGVSSTNTAAVQFYQKMQFSVREEAAWGYIMTRSCDGSS